MKHTLEMEIRQKFPVCGRDAAVALGVLAAATGAAVLVKMMAANDQDVLMLFILAVLLISRCTNGYFYGTLGSVAGVFLVNCMVEED